MFCNKCGNQIADGAKFCGRCGNPCAPTPSAIPVPPVMEELELPKIKFPMDISEEPVPVEPEPVQAEPVPTEMPSMESVYSPPPKPEPVYAPVVHETAYAPPVPETPYAPPVYSEPQPMASTNDLPPQYRPMGAWAYFGLRLLYMVPIVGLVFMIVFTFSSGNINRRSFTRSYWCEYLIFFGLLSLFVGIMAAVDIDLLEDIFDTIFDF